MSRVPAFRTIDLDLSGPLAQRAEAGRVAGQLYSAKTPQEAQAFLGGAYQAADTSALAFNNALFDATQGGYQQLLADQTSAQDAIAGGYADLAARARQRNEGIAADYGTLNRDVLADIEGIGQTRARDINDAYARSLADQQQRMISSGLGNSTVLGAIDRGLASDRERNLTANAEAVANLRAGYRSRLGQAGLDFRERSLGVETGLGQAGLNFDERAAANNANVLQNQIGFLNAIQAPYPDAGLYAALAQQYGAAGQSDADRALLMQLAGQDRQFAQQQLQTATEPQFSTPAFGGGAARGGGAGFFQGPTPTYGGGGPIAVPSAGVGAGAFFGGPSAGVYAPALSGAGGGGYVAGQMLAGGSAAGDYSTAPQVGSLGGGALGGGSASGGFGGAYTGASAAGSIGGFGGDDFGDYLGGMFGY